MTTTPSDPVIELLARWPEGEEVHARLMPMVYRDLRCIAASLFAHERRDHTLPPTGLVTEAYIRMRRGGPWHSRGHFFGAAARAMRQTLVDYARRRNAYKRGGQFERVDWDDIAASDLPARSEILMMDQALCHLEALHPRWSRIVQLRYFAGLSVGEVSEALGISVSTVKEDWSRAKVWLKEQLEAL